jgi:hypothetical protein
MPAMSTRSLTPTGKRPAQVRIVAHVGLRRPRRRERLLGGDRGERLDLAVDFGNAVQTALRHLDRRQLTRAVGTSDRAHGQQGPVHGRSA